MKITSSINVVLATVLLSSIFLIGSTTSLSTAGLGEYDPWADLDDDGNITVLDAIRLANAFRSSGTPINKTALLYEVNATFTELLNRIDILNETLDLHEEEISFLRNQISTLNNTIQELELKVFVLNATKLGPPVFDSGWISLSVGPNTIYFGSVLNTTNVFVYIVGKKSLASDQHQIDYGGYAHGLNYYGVYWENLTQTYIQINRHLNDQDWNYIRILVFKIPEP